MNADRPEIAFLATDITQPHALGSFDLGVLMEVFEHIPPADCEAFLAGVRRLLKPGGTLLLTVPHANKPAPVIQGSLALTVECLTDRW
jgi:2-polyprenyl-3-methyl-5-hydroxy-6-metoxy-1,4-benzoquinol methylase